MGSGVDEERSGMKGVGFGASLGFLGALPNVEVNIPSELFPSISGHKGFEALLLDSMMSIPVEHYLLAHFSLYSLFRD